MDVPDLCKLCSCVFTKRKKGSGLDKRSILGKLRNCETPVYSALQTVHQYKGPAVGYLCGSCYINLEKASKSITSNATKRKDVTPIKTPTSTKKRKIICTPVHSHSSPLSTSTPCKRMYFPKSTPHKTNQTTKTQNRNTTAIDNALIKSKYKTAIRHILARGVSAERAFRTVVVNMIKKEVRQYIKSNTFPVLQNSASISTFSSINLINEIQLAMPMLTDLLHATMPSKVTQDKFSSIILLRIGLMLTIPLYTHSPRRFKFLQTLSGVQMWRYGSSEKCFNHLGICQSNSAIRRQVDRFCEESDMEILKWKEDLENRHTIPACPATISSISPQTVASNLTIDPSQTDIIPSIINEDDEWADDSDEEDEDYLPMAEKDSIVDAMLDVTIADDFDESVNESIDEDESLDVHGGTSAHRMMSEYAREEEIDRLKRKLAEKTDEVSQLQSQLTKLTLDQSSAVTQTSTEPSKLDKESIGRYSRQLLLTEICVKGQLCLMKSKVLIVGAGGLGCPSAIYLAAAGVGCLGIIDYDEVELSNLHRQILHTEARVNMSKSASAAFACNQLNSKVNCVSYCLQLDSTNASEIIQLYDIVLDATDNVATRYLLNDACVLLGKPLVSGSALRFEGQLTVYNYEGGPCYRCLYATPPPPNMVTNCVDGGVIGAVPGVIGTLQALEAIKIITGITASYGQKLLLFDGLDGSFRTIKLRPRQAKCAVCGDSPTITQLIDYEEFCGSKANDKDRALTLLSSSERISVQDYKQIVDTDQTHLLIDVRPPVELEICKLPYKAINIHPDKFSFWQEDTEQLLRPIIDELSKPCGDSLLPIFTLCRHGNDSQIAAKVLQEKLCNLPVIVKDIVGGLAAWAKHIDPEFPEY